MCAHKPAYGREMQRPQEAVTFNDIVQRGGGALDATRDDDGVVFYNGRATVVRKARLARDRGLAGVFWWEAGQDVSDAAQSLLGAVHAFVVSTSHATTISTAAAGTEKEL